MYKGSSRFGQRLRESARSSTNQRKSLKLGKRRKSKVAAELENIAEEAKLRNWASYVRQCKTCGTTPAVPLPVLNELKRRKLID
jgi:hypothetical protein